MWLSKIHKSEGEGRLSGTVWLCPASACSVWNSKEMQESLRVLFHPLPPVPPTKLLTRYPDLLVQTVLQISFLDVLDMVSAGCSPLISVRRLFMCFANIDVLRGRSQLELTGLTKVSSGAQEQLLFKCSLPRREVCRLTASSWLFLQDKQGIVLKRVFFHIVSWQRVYHVHWTLFWKLETGCS